MKTKTSGTKEWSTYSLNFTNGCSYDCGYCVDGNTLIFMRDGTMKLITNLKKGDKIWSVDEKGYIKEAIIENIWMTEPKFAYKIELENGSELICSDNHRWLTDRGWKFTIGEMNGTNRRPFLTTQNKIRSITNEKSLKRFIINYNFMKGYLSGAIRGDGNLKIYDYSGKRRNKDIQYHFRYTIKDSSSVSRVKEYLNIFNIFPIEFKFKDNYGKEWDAIRTSSEEDFNSIISLIDYLDDPDYYAGFLSGIFDSEGSFSENILRIYNTDLIIISFIKKSLEYHKINYSIQEKVTENRKNIYNITITHKDNLINFFNITNIAILRKNDFSGIRIKNSIKIKDIYSLNMIEPMFDITTSTGTFIANGFVSHNCYAKARANRFKQILRKFWRFMKNRAKPSITDNKKTSSKTNKLYNGVIMTPTTHDILPMNLHLAKKYYYDLLKHGNHLLIVTKGNPRVIKELWEHIKEFNDQIVWRISITTLNEDSRKYWEHGAPSISKRIELLKFLYEAGANTSVSSEPFLDDTILQLVKTVLPYIREKIWVGVMNFVHVPKELKTEKSKELYKPENLRRIKRNLDKLQDDRIVYKDAFLNNIPSENDLLLYLEE